MSNTEVSHASTNQLIIGISNQHKKVQYIGNYIIEHVNSLQIL